MNRVSIPGRKKSIRSNVQKRAEAKRVSETERHTLGPKLEPSTSVKTLRRSLFIRTERKDY